MTTLISKINGKYTKQDIFKYVPFKKTIKIVKYNKKLMRELNYTPFEIKYFLFFHKIIKPISNIEDYIPIIKRLLPMKDNNNNDIIKLFCKYLNENNEGFIPQINKINGNEYILDNLNNFKIGFTNTFLDYFYDKENELNFNKLCNFCKKYGKKIKEINFMDSNLPLNLFCDEALFIIGYIIKHSNIQKVEDNYIYKYSFFNYLFNMDFSFFLEKYESILKDEGNNVKDWDKPMSKIKSYSLYYEESKTDSAIDSFNYIVSYKGINIEELEITKVNKNNYLTFVNSLKQLKNLKSLKISCKSNYLLLYNKISEVITKNSLITLDMNIKSFDGGMKIINKNLNSLEELTIKINKDICESNTIINTISNINNLRKLTLIADFQIFDEKNITYLNLKDVEYLKIPLYINAKIFDFNKFFEKIPKLKTLIFYGIDFSNNNTILMQENIDILTNLKLNIDNIKFLKKIHFLKGKNNASFFIKKFLDVLLNKTIIENIKEIKIEDCNFNKDILFRDFIQELSLFPNLKNLSLNGNNFEIGEQLNYEDINNFENLEEFNFKGLNYELNEIKILYFLYKFSEKCKKLHELGFSCKGLNPYDLNLIFMIVKNYKYLTKLNIFDNYSKEDYYFNKEDGFYKNGINIGEIDNYCMYDLRNINLEKVQRNNSSFYYKVYTKNIINDYFCEKQKNRFVNEKENYYSYQKILDNDPNLNKLFYLKKEKSFIIGDIKEAK